MRILFNIIIYSSFFIFDVTQPMGNNKESGINQSVSAFLDLNSVSKNINYVMDTIKNQATIVTVCSLPLYCVQGSNSSVPEPELYGNSAMPFTVITLCGMLGCCVAWCTIVGKAKMQQLEKQQLLEQKANVIPVITKKEKEDDTEIKLEGIGSNTNIVDCNNIETYHSLSLSDDSD